MTVKGMKKKAALLCSVGTRVQLITTPVSSSRAHASTALLTWHKVWLWTQKVYSFMFINRKTTGNFTTQQGKMQRPYLSLEWWTTYNGMLVAKLDLAMWGMRNTTTQVCFNHVGWQVSDNSMGNISICVWSHLCLKRQFSSNNPASGATPVDPLAMD